MPNSRIIAESRRSPVALQATRAWKSPSTCTGSRTLARTIFIRLSSMTPARTRGSSGRKSPSWNTCRLSGDCPQPPMSTTWVVEENSATSRPSWKAGEVTTMS